ncbi:hypothetical protein GCM10027286_28620 [Virgibacillus ainsalahensis]
MAEGSQNRPYCLKLFQEGFYMGKLDNKVAVITGGVSGIGAATAELFFKKVQKLF